MRIERHDRAERRSHSEGTLEMQVTAERPEPVDQPPQSRARCRMRAADAVVAHLDLRLVVCAADDDRCLTGGRVLRDICQRLCDGEVERRLNRPRRSLLEIALDVHGYG